MTKVKLTEFEKGQFDVILRIAKSVKGKNTLDEVQSMISEVRNITKSEKKYTFLINLYIRQLRQFTGAKFVMPFRVNTPDQGRKPRYFLIHSSNHIVALKEMKNSMALTSDKPYSFEAIGIPKNQEDLFEDPEKISIVKNIELYLKSKYPDWILFEDLEKWAYINTNGINRSIKLSLLELENNKKLIEIERKQGQKKTTVVKGAKIRYINY